jgi:twinkle protein
LSKWVEKPFRPGPLPQMTEDDLLQAFAEMKKYLEIVEIGESGTTLDSILCLAKIKKGIDALIIDPWNELESRMPYGERETDFIGKSLTRIRRFSRANNISMWIVAHPAKMNLLEGLSKYRIPTPYDISGSAHWYNKADNCITVYREEDCTELYVQKVRFKMNGSKGLVSLRYDTPTGVFYDLENHA